MLHKKENSCINYVEMNITFIKQFFSLYKRKIFCWEKTMFVYD